MHLVQMIVQFEALVEVKILLPLLLLVNFKILQIYIIILQIYIITLLRRAQRDQQMLTLGCPSVHRLTMVMEKVINASKVSK